MYPATTNVVAAALPGARHLLGYTMVETTLNGLQTLPDYRKQREHVFRSESSIEWFVRKHRQALVDAGALVLLAGRWHAHEQKFDVYVLQAGAEAARAVAK